MLGDLDFQSCHNTHNTVFVSKDDKIDLILCSDQLCLDDVARDLSMGVGMSATWFDSTERE